MKSIIVIRPEDILGAAILAVAFTALIGYFVFDRVCSLVERLKRRKPWIK